MKPPTIQTKILKSNWDTLAFEAVPKLQFGSNYPFYQQNLPIQTMNIKTANKEQGGYCKKMKIK